MKVVAEGRPAGTSLMEDHTYHMVPGNDRVLGPHTLEVCPSITYDTPSLEINPRPIDKPRRGSPTLSGSDSKPAAPSGRPATGVLSEHPQT